MEPLPAILLRCGGRGAAFRQGGSQVHIAQPALSNQVMALEKELGVQLFLRTTRRGGTDSGRGRPSTNGRSGSSAKWTCRPRSPGRWPARRRGGLRSARVYPATIGVPLLPCRALPANIPDIRLHIESGTTDDIIRHIEAGRINLGFIRPVENIGSLRFFSIAHERYLLAVAKESPLSLKSEIDHRGSAQ